MSYSTDYPLHYLLDWQFDPRRMMELLTTGTDPNAALPPYDETALHVAVRRRRTDCIEPLLAHGAAINAKTRGGKTPYAHAARRKFSDVTRKLAALGADTSLHAADEFAVSVMNRDLAKAKAILAENPGLIAGFNPEESRLLPDLAGHNDPEGLAFLIDVGMDLSARGLDNGTALHQAAWFGQPAMAELLVESGAPIDIAGDDHRMPPLGWVAHGSVNSGGAAKRQGEYVAICRLLLENGASMAHPSEPEQDPRGAWLLEMASPAVQKVLSGEG